MARYSSAPRRGQMLCSGSLVRVTTVGLWQVGVPPHEEWSFGRHWSCSRACAARAPRRTSPTSSGCSSMICASRYRRSGSGTVSRSQRCPTSSVSRAMAASRSRTRTVRSACAHRAAILSSRAGGPTRSRSGTGSRASARRAATPLSRCLAFSKRMVTLPSARAKHSSPGTPPTTTARVLGALR